MLKKSLGLTQATAMVVGTIIGASIFVQPSEITSRMPSLAGTAAVWLAAPRSYRQARTLAAGTQAVTQAPAAEKAG